MISWFRMYTELLHDPKVQRLPPALFKFWVNLLCIVNEYSRDTGELPTAEKIAFAARMRPVRSHSAVSALTTRGLVDARDGGLFLHGWANRQYKSDSSTDRVKRYRNGKVTPPETETETEGPSPSEKAAGERFFEAKNRGQEVGALVDVAQAHGRKVAGGILADALKSHPKTAVMDALMQALGRNAADIGTYMKGVLRNAKTGRRTTGARPVVTAADLEQSSKPPEEGGF